MRGRSVGVVFQEPMTSFNPLHTIGRQVGEALAVHGDVPRRELNARVLELLRQVQLQDPEARSEAYPHQLSGGQRQRAMIAMALANGPDLLVADEPTTALDVTVEFEILRLLKSLQKKRGMAMLFITHDLGIVRRLADRVAVMHAGRVIETAETERLFHSPPPRLYPRIARSRARGRPTPVPEGAPVVLEGEDLRVWFPIRRRAVPPHRRACQGGRRHHPGGAGRRNRRRGRRIRLRQDDPGSRLAAAGPLQGSDRLSRAGNRWIALLRAAAPAQCDAGRVPGSLWLAQPAHVGRRHCQRGSCRPRPDGGTGGEAAAHGGGTGGGRHRTRVHRSLSARIFRRPAPADRDRPGDHSRTGSGGARRADFGPRPDRAGTGDGSSPRPAAAAETGLCLRQPRSSGGADTGPQGDRDAGGKGGRERGNGGILPGPPYGVCEALVDAAWGGERIV